MKKVLFTPCFAFLFCFIGFAQNPPQNLGPKVNSVEAELRPTLSPDGKRLYYMMEKDVSQTKKKEDNTIQAVCFTEKDETGNWKPFTPAPKPFNIQRDNAIYWVSPDGNTALIRGEFVDGKPIGRGISKTVKTASGWSDPRSIKIEGYSQMSIDRYTGLTLTIDLKHMLLYFSEEKNSHLNDVYYSRLLAEDHWSRPVKISSGVSLEDYDEIAPYLAADQKTLFFSSNRPGGLGDYDIWMTKRIDDTWMSWTDPVNMGKNINTEVWDAYFSIDVEGEFGYWSTTKNALGKADLVTNKLEPWQQVRNKVDLVANVSLKDSSEEKLRGKIKIQVEGDSSAEALVFENGELKTALSYGKKYIITTDVDGVESISDTIDLSAYGVAKTMRKFYLLNTLKPKHLIDSEGNWVDASGRILPSSLEDSLLLESYYNGELAKSLSKESVLFDFGKATLREESAKMLDKIARLLRMVPDALLDLSAHTDNIGSNLANLLLSEKRAESVKNYLTSRKVAESQLQAKGYGETKPVATNSTEVGRQQNRRVEINFLKK
jgi:OOP family OmpA-OmpF porin